MSKIYGYVRVSSREHQGNIQGRHRDLSHRAATERIESENSCNEKFAIMVYNILDYCRNSMKESAKKKSLQKQYPFPAFIRIKSCKL